MLCKSLGHLCGCDGTFLFPQATGHVSQDHEEPVFLESTARVPTEDETQVGPLLGLCLCLCSYPGLLGMFLDPQQTQVEQEGSVCEDSPEVLEFSSSIPD